MNLNRVHGSYCHNSYQYGPHCYCSIDPSNAKPLNHVARSFLWFENNKTPLMAKIGAVVLGLLGLIGGIALMGAFIAAPMLLSIPYIAKGVKQRQEYKELINSLELDRKRMKEIQIQYKERRAAETYQAVKDALGGDEAYERIPILDAVNHPLYTLLGFRPEQLNYSVMRGFGSDGEPFVCLKVRENMEHRVLVFYRDPRDLTFWHFSRTVEDPLGPNHLEQIRQIVVTRNHPRFTLV